MPLPMTAFFLLGILSTQWVFIAHTRESLYIITSTGILGCSLIATIAIAYHYHPQNLVILRSCIYLMSTALLGWTWASLHIEQIKRTALAPSLFFHPISMEGRIVGLPEINAHKTRFLWRLSRINGESHTALLQLTGFGKFHPSLHIGDLWKLDAILKPPHSTCNPDEFDREAWWFSHGIQGTGTLINKRQPLLMQCDPWFAPIERLRQRVAEKITQAIGTQPTVGLITALVMGAQQGITEPQWQTMRATGTNHLMAIAGVHIGFVVSFFHMLSSRIWRIFPSLLLRIPAINIATFFSLLAAIIYSAMAGFALPTQRALVMLLLILIGLSFRRHLSAWHAFSTAMFVVLVMDPLCIISVSFWLSFAAVAAILFGMRQRLHLDSLWWRWGRLQWVITLSLLPFTIWLFHQASLISFLANLIAVPAIGLLVMPLSLLGAMFTFIEPTTGAFLLKIAAKNIAGIWWLLDQLANCPLATWQPPPPSASALLAAIVGIGLWIAPSGLPGRWLSIIWLLPLLFQRTHEPPLNEAWITLFDTGNSLVVGIATTQHVIVIADHVPQRGTPKIESLINDFLRTHKKRSADRVILNHASLKIPAHSYFASYSPDQEWRWNGVTMKSLERGKIWRISVPHACMDVVLAPSYSFISSCSFIITSHKNTLESQPSVEHGYLLVARADSAVEVHEPPLASIGTTLLTTAHSGAITVHLNEKNSIIMEQRQKKIFWENDL